MYALLTCINKLSNSSDVILPREENHGITLRRLKQVCTPISASEKRRNGHSYNTVA